MTESYCPGKARVRGIAGRVSQRPCPDRGRPRHGDATVVDPDYVGRGVGAANLPGRGSGQSQPGELDQPRVESGVIPAADVRRRLRNAVPGLDDQPLVHRTLISSWRRRIINRRGHERDYPTAWVVVP